MTTKTRRDWDWWAEQMLIILFGLIPTAMLGCAFTWLLTLPGTVTDAAYVAQRERVFTILILSLIGSAIAAYVINQVLKRIWRKDVKTEDAGGGGSDQRPVKFTNRHQVTGVILVKGDKGRWGGGS